MEYELNEGFSITDDKLADWALRKIREEEEERDRLIDLAKSQISDLEAQIQDINDQCGNKTRFLKGHLAAYFQNVPHKETKTQETYKLLSGSLVMKKASKSISRDDEKLLAWLKENNHLEFIKTIEKVAWAEFKKELEITEDGIVDEMTGELPDGLTVEEVPAEFTVKF